MGSSDLTIAIDDLSHDESEALVGTSSRILGADLVAETKEIFRVPATRV
jgi:hypothetical protein